MLLFVILSIAVCRWKMNKLLGLTMFALYFVFLIISVMLEDKIISCPVSVWHVDTSRCVGIQQHQKGAEVAVVLLKKKKQPEL